MSLPFVNLRRIQVCKTRDFFCKLGFFASLPRRHDTPWHFAPTDIGCPRSRAKKRTLSRAGKCRVEREVRAKSKGTFTFTLAAANGVLPQAFQQFTLTV
jgi:hypothetical protein